jgi:hypothetical protein
MRILVAEDDAALGSFVKKGRESEYYAVDVSTDGKEVCAMAGELDFDLVVLDLNLPRLDGVAILRFLRTRKPQYADSGADRVHPGGRPRAVPGPGRGRLSGEAGSGGRRSEARPGGARVERAVCGKWTGARAISVARRDDWKRRTIPCAPAWDAIPAKLN